MVLGHISSVHPLDLLKPMRHLTHFEQHFTRSVKLRNELWIPRFCLCRSCPPGKGLLMSQGDTWQMLWMQPHVDTDLLESRVGYSNNLHHVGVSNVHNRNESLRHQLLSYCRFSTRFPGEVSKASLNEYHLQRLSRSFSNTKSSTLSLPTTSIAATNSIPFSYASDSKCKEIKKHSVVVTSSFTFVSTFTTSSPIFSQSIPSISSSLFCTAVSFI